MLGLVIVLIHLSKLLLEACETVNRIRREVWVLLLQVLLLLVVGCEELLIHLEIVLVYWIIA